MAGKSVALPECGLCMKSVKNGVQCGDCRKLFHFSCSLFKVKNCVEDDWRCSSCCKKRERRRRRTEKDNIILRLRKELEEEKERVKRLALENEELKNFKSEPGTVVESEKGMVFHSRVGSNVIISNNGRTIEKKDMDVNSNGAAFTSRPLKNEELFEVILDKRGSKWTFGFGIGVLTIRPEDFEFPRSTWHSPHVWIYHSRSIWNNGTVKRSNYGEVIDFLPAGTRFGVMKKSSGDIHFFINGEDKGSAVSGFYGLVYGIADLYFNAEKITILKP